MIAALLGAAAVVLPSSPAWVTIPAPELRARYDAVWAVSDVHGHRRALEKLLVAAGLAAGKRDALHWSPSATRQLLVVAGDCIDGGPDGAGVVLLLEALQAEAGASGSRVIVLLGNHEVDYLDRPAIGEDVAHRRFERFLRTEPAAAIVGSWLFAHAGYVDADDDDEALRAYFGRLDAAWARGDQYRLLRHRRSLVAYHDWWESSRRRALVRAQLARLGLDAVVFGHDPDALGARGTVAADATGAFVKLDSGMKSGRSHGMLLRCDVAELGARSPPPRACRTVGPDGELRALPVR
jgi:hypothetical protein